MNNETTYKEEQINLASLLKALAHPARLAIIEVLLNKNSCVCSTIVDELPLAQATISQHLKELKKAGLITGEISGRNTCYCINHKTWDEFKDLVLPLLTKVKNQQHCC
jgi:DNA-binding transcriptional ArsR family regulator